MKKNKKVKAIVAKKLHRGRPHHSAYGGVQRYLTSQINNLKSLTHAEVVNRVFENVIWGKNAEGKIVRAQRCSEPSRASVNNWVAKVIPGLTRRAYNSSIKKSPTIKFNVNEMSRDQLETWFNQAAHFMMDNSGATKEELMTIVK